MISDHLIERTRERSRNDRLDLPSRAKQNHDCMVFVGHLQSLLPLALPREYKESLRLHDGGHSAADGGNS